MPLLGVFPDSCFHISGTAWSRAIGEQCLMDVLRAKSSRPAYDYLIVLLVPFKY
jgi:hypothetical protein